MAACVDVLCWPATRSAATASAVSGRNAATRGASGWNIRAQPTAAKAVAVACNDGMPPPSSSPGAPAGRAC
eukprot:scaffold4394_cov113-Isochrysis_galbana.AAC.10